LDTPEVDAANVGALVEAEDGAGLVECDVLGQADDIPVEGAANVVELRKSAPELRKSMLLALTSEKMNVFAGSKPMAMMSLALLLQYP
jgi:hypothetical protein